MKKNYKIHCKSEAWDVEFTDGLGYTDRIKAYELFFVELTFYKMAEGDIFELIEEDDNGIDTIVHRIEIK